MLFILFGGSYFKVSKLEAPWTKNAIVELKPEKHTTLSNKYEMAIGAHHSNADLLGISSESTILVFWGYKMIEEQHSTGVRSCRGLPSILDRNISIAVPLQKCGQPSLHSMSEVRSVQVVSDIQSHEEEIKLLKIVS